MDEFTWDAVAQEQERPGPARLLQEGTKLHGCPITLRSGEGYGRRCGSCGNWRCARPAPAGPCSAGLPDGREFSVIFNRAEGAPLEAEPLFREVNPGPDADYLVTLRLLTVGPPSAPPTPDP
ncbi:hypothetical protein P4050_00470 [Pseudomonas aeruginosa]|nr:hypothetical protein [Pseudomonas aeruginosa]